MLASGMLPVSMSGVLLSGSQGMEGSMMAWQGATRASSSGAKMALSVRVAP